MYDLMDHQDAIELYDSYGKRALRYDRPSFLVLGWEEATKVLALMDETSYLTIDTFTPETIEKALDEQATIARNVDSARDRLIGWMFVAFFRYARDIAIKLSNSKSFPRKKDNHEKEPKVVRATS